MAGAFKDHFSVGSADYAAYRPRYPDELADRLAGLTSGRGLALDCGTGSGQLAVLLAGRFDRVVAIDASAAQLAVAVPHPRVEYRHAAAEASGLAEGSADLVTAAQAAHWFDHDAFWREARRVLRPGGAVALIAYGIVQADGRVGDLLDRFYHDALGPYWPPERRLVESGYRTLAFPFAEQAVPPLAMRAEWPLPALLGYVGTWSAVRQASAARGPALMEELAAALAAAWGDPGRPREIRWPLGMRVGRV